MPKDKKLYSTDKASVIKKRRRDIHRQLSSDKTEEHLLQRRTRYRESYNQKLLIDHSLSTSNNEEPPLSYPQHQLTEQIGVTITEIPPLSGAGNSSTINTSALLLDKGKNTIGCPTIFEIGSTSGSIVEPILANTSSINTPALLLDKGKNTIGSPCIFEIGSTSGAPHNPEVTTIAMKGPTSVPHRWTNSKEMCNRNKDMSYWSFVLALAYNLRVQISTFIARSIVEQVDQSLSLIHLSSYEASSSSCLALCIS